MYICMFVCYTNNHIRTCKGEKKLCALFRRKGRRIRRNHSNIFSWSATVLLVWLIRWTTDALSHAGSCRNQKCLSRSWSAGFSTDSGSRDETTARLVLSLASVSPQEGLEPRERSNKVLWFWWLALGWDKSEFNPSFEPVNLGKWMTSLSLSFFLEKWGWW